MNSIIEMLNREIEILISVIDSYLENNVYVDLQSVKNRNWTAIPFESGLFFIESELENLIDYSKSKNIENYYEYAIEEVESDDQFVCMAPTIDEITKFNIKLGSLNYIFFPSNLDFFIICRSSESLNIIVGESSTIEKIIGMSIEDTKKDFQDFIKGYNAHPSLKNHQEYLIKIYNYYFWTME